MAIKLKARLSAYSKVATGAAPNPGLAVDGAVVGVNQGKYTFFEPASEEKIDKLFGGDESLNIGTVTKEQIDKLFWDKPNKNLKPVTSETIDTLFENEIPNVVSHSAIDSLFTGRKNY